MRARLGRACTHRRGRALPRPATISRSVRLATAPTPTPTPTLPSPLTLTLARHASRRRTVAAVAIAVAVAVTVTMRQLSVASPPLRRRCAPRPRAACPGTHLAYRMLPPLVPTRLGSIAWWTSGRGGAFKHTPCHSGSAGAQQPSQGPGARIRTSVVGSALIGPVPAVPLGGRAVCVGAGGAVGPNRGRASDARRGPACGSRPAPTIDGQPQACRGGGGVQRAVRSVPRVV